MLMIMLVLKDSFMFLMFLMMLVMKEELFSNMVSFSGFNGFLVFMSVLSFMMLLLMVESNLLFWLLFYTTLFCIIFFTTTSIMLLWLSFELATLPMLFSILLFSNQMEALLATHYLSCYAILSGLPFLMVLSNITQVENSWMLFNTSTSVSFVICLPFLIKLPAYSLHIWLPLAHVEAPTSSSMVLAATMLKLGSMGLFYVSLVFPTFILMLSIMGVILIPLITMTQSDVKCLIAYSSVAHMGFFSFSLYLMSLSSFYSSWLMQVVHGFISSSLFLLMGTMSHLLSTRLLYYMNNINYILLSLLCFLNSAAPLTLAFYSEVLFYQTLISLSYMSSFIILISSISVLYYNLYLFIISIKNKELKFSEMQTMLMIVIMVLMDIVLLV